MLSIARKISFISMDSMTPSVASCCLMAGKRTPQLLLFLPAPLSVFWGHFLNFLCPVQLITSPPNCPNIPIFLPFPLLLFPSASCLGAPGFFWTSIIAWSIFVSVCLSVIPGCDVQNSLGSKEFSLGSYQQVGTAFCRGENSTGIRTKY